MKIYRVISAQGKVKHSNAFKGFYDTPQRAQRAIQSLPKSFTVYKKKEGAEFSWDLARDENGHYIVDEVVQYNWRVQEAEVTWHDYPVDGNS